MRLNSKYFTPEKRADLCGRWSRGFLALSIGLCAVSTPARCQTTATVTVNATSPTATVPPEGYGIDTAVYDNYLISSAVASQLKAAGINAIRYPGGSYADIFNFISGTDQTLNGGYFASGDTFNNFMSEVVLPEGGKSVITVNYGSNVGATGPALPSEAASWVQYANVTNHYGIVYWEIGNEIYGNGYYSGSLDWEEDLHVLSQTESNRQGNSALSPTAYGTNAAAFIKAMKAVDPTIKCGVFVNTASYYTNWDQDVLTAVSNGLNGSGLTLDFVIVHWYPGGSDAQILAAQSQIPAMVAQIRSDIRNYYKLGNGNSLQIAITESGASVVGGVFPALFTTDDYYTWLENGASNVEYQELHNGFLDNSNTPLGPWYGTSFASTVARPGDNFVSASSSNALLRAHAVNRADGKVAVVLINDDPSNSTRVSVNVSNATLSSSGTEYTLGNANFPGGSSYASEGVQQSSITGVGNTFTVTVPAYTEYAIVIPTGSGGGCTPTAITPYLQVNGAAWQQTNTATVASGSTVNLGPQPTGGTWSWTGPNGFTSAAREIDGIPLTTGANTFVATYTNSSGCKSTETFTVTVSGSSGNLIPNGTYVITSVHSGLALTDPGGSTTHGEDMQQSTVTDATSQEWTVNNLGNNVITLVNVASGLALDVTGASKSNGALVDQWPLSGNANQQWHVTAVAGGAYELTSVNSGLALDVDGGGITVGEAIDQYTYGGNAWQQWILTSR